ncbi:hypothetical protein T459_15455 [Capsicum annuum]|uniref:Uncharacterized protein n=1 Tax=Capsicum annuum TaxID=4072 RepID=A0A2G2ZKB9_CAPAN|nr:hypothetical protein FXO37_16904 [Capsicum annuum]PHT82440.1 hypothetical protein T459_15455 [Capsicum annuum]
MANVPYSSAVRSLMYAMVCTRPDIAHAVGVVSRFLENFGKEHWEVFKWILRYLRGTSADCLCFGGTDPILKGYTDTNMTGSIPSKIGEAPGIRSISLSGNKILGSLPESFCHASNILQVLDLSNNSLSGTIRRNLGNCRSLIYLNLGQKKLPGSVTEEFEHITSLRYLDLNGNQFEGSFPAVIENFQDLEILNLAGYVTIYWEQIHTYVVLLMRWIAATIHLLLPKK